MLGLRPEAYSLGAYPGDHQGSLTGTTPPRNAAADGLLALQAGTRLREDAEGRRRACWSVFREALGCEPATRSGKGAWRKAIADLVQAGATPEGLRHAIAVYRRRWPGLELTPTAVAKHWHVLTGPGGGGAPAPGERSAQDGPRLAQLNRNGVTIPPDPGGPPPAQEAGADGPRLAWLNRGGAW